MRDCTAQLSIATGDKGHKTIATGNIERYQTSQSIDNDADSFSVQFADLSEQLDLAFVRDNEVVVSLFLTDLAGNPQQIFTGMTDVAVLQEDLSAPLIGRDLPSSIALDSDAMPGRWRDTRPDHLISARAHKLGIKRLRIATMKKMHAFYTDASEKEWAFWYRLARMRDMYMWSDEFGGLIVNKLGYSMTPAYYFGQPSSKHPTASWIPCEPSVTLTSTKQTRLAKVIVYGTDSKKGTTQVAQSVDPHIGAWLKQPVEVLSSTKHRSYSTLKQEAAAEVFEGIVGATEISLTVRDGNTAIHQNRMALVNLPDQSINNVLMFVVGVDRTGDNGSNPCVQIVRLREKGFALTHRIPDAPALRQPKGGTDNYKPVSSVGDALAQEGVRWAQSFVRATHEFGSAWDFAVFCGVLLSICSHESGFTNVREEKAGAFGNGEEWQPYDKWLHSGDRLNSTETVAQLLYDYERTFANDPKNSLNPFYTRTSDANAGVGPMQLTSSGVKAWADAYGWNGKENTDEYQGGRWNPDSNIRAAARSLAKWLTTSPPADPTNADSIWIGVRRYAVGLSTISLGDTYVKQIKALFDKTYFKLASEALAATKTLPTGTGTSINIPGHGALKLPDTTPDEVLKAINWAERHLGDPYKWAGYGPYYDCSSFVTKALAEGSVKLKAKLDPPVESTKHHGDDTYSLFKKGRFPSVKHDSLLPGDLVFFLGTSTSPDHVGMYLWDGFFIEDPRPGKYVDIQSLNDNYWQGVYQGARRVADWPGTVSSPEPGTSP